LFNFPPLYIILDDLFFKPDELTGLTTSLLEGGARLFQLRVKNMPAKDFLEMAKTILPLIRFKKGKLIINDRVDIAISSDADGVHLGQDDIPIEKASAIFKGKIIGVSTHSLEEAKKAQKNGATYIGFGPVFKTKTKKNADLVKGIEGIKEIASVVDIPVVAIGGITRQAFPNVLKAGAASAAVISAILSAKDPGGEVKCWLKENKK